jgi:serine/threonine-protein kinase
MPEQPLADVLAETLAADSAAPRRALPPSLAARYEDLALLGEGGMGVVYRGFDPRLGRAVALKLIKGDDPALWRRFIQEARAQARVEHDNVCRVYEAGQADGEPFVVMQLIDGEPLSRLASALSREQGVKLLREVAGAVHEAHRLGLIHRDLKPQNILVETLPDGSLKPYVVDFGLAREVAEQGQTVTGAVLGTPAYMPPEQALGDVRSLDRRSDVWSLGATLYELCAGRTPFVDENPWKLLMKVAYEEPPTLSGLKKAVPPDLETIIMKCLERDPARRYDSARALGEDLQRFLDGDPIHARRASLAYVAWKRAKKHKLAAALAGVALAAAIALGAVWVKSRRDVAEGARLAQALGEDVKGMELFLRNAYGMPLHDVERERGIVRERLKGIEARMRAAGRVGEGPGNYAMGRGYLALGDPGAARDHLERARAAGYRSAALDVALGQALGELFRRAVEESKRITNEEERKKRLAGIERELRDPALARLRAGVGAEVEVETPAYAEGLIALYEGRHEAALGKAREAFAAAPWLYEAKKLEGDAHYALGSPFRHDAAFDYEKMMSHFRPAAEAYKAAGEIARSDPGVHRAECELWEKIGLAEGVRGADTGPSYDHAEDACRHAVTASSADGLAKIQRALTLSARLSAPAITPPEGAIPVAEEAVRAADEALQTSPVAVMAHYAKARALYYQAMVLDDLNREVNADPALAAYRAVVELDPQFTWAVSELGDVYVLKANIEQKHGRDARAALSCAMQQYDRASALDPAFSVPMRRKIKVHLGAVENDLEHGRSTDAALDDLAAAASSIERRLGANEFVVVYWKVRALRLRALHELATGRDPRLSTRAALRIVDQAPTAHRRGWVLLEATECRLIDASHTRERGQVDEVRRAAREGTATGIPDDASWRVLAARADVLAATDTETTIAFFDDAIHHLSPVLEQNSTEAQPYQLMAELYALRAAWSQRHRRETRGDLAAAEALVEKALAHNPHFARAHATRGLLALVEARALREGPERASAARRATAAFEAAFGENPRLAHARDAERRELAAMAP